MHDINFMKMVHGFDVINVIPQQLGYSLLKKEQLDIIVRFLNGSDVFTVLPTEFGEALCCACIPFVFNGMYP